MAAHFFVTGTDTDAGKTYCSTALLRGLLASGVRCAALPRCPPPPVTPGEMGRARVWTPVTAGNLVWRVVAEKDSG